MIPEQLDGKSSLKKHPRICPYQLWLDSSQKNHDPQNLLWGFLYKNRWVFFPLPCLMTKKKKVKAGQLFPFAMPRRKNCVANDDILRGFESLSQGLPMVDQTDGQVEDQNMPTGDHGGGCRITDFLGCRVWLLKQQQKWSFIFLGGFPGDEKCLAK